MDKFGIFNLLSSLINDNITPKEENLTEKTQEDNNEKVDASKPSLRENMLNTIKNHDQIVNRVYKKYK